MKKHTVSDLPPCVDKNNIALISSDDIKKIAKPLFEKLGITYFAHTISWHDGYGTTLITNADVMIHWIVEKYSLPGNNPIGPRILPGNYFVPYLDNIYPFPYREALSKTFHVDNMFMIVEAYPGREDFFSFATEPDNHKIIHCYFNHIDIFRRFIATYKVQADSFIKLAIKTRVPIPLSSNFTKTDCNVLSNNEKNSLLNQLKLKRIPLSNGLYLTARETDCLLGYTEGRSTKEIAKDMIISYRTVETHLENAKEKLNCNRKSQLIDVFLKIIEQYSLYRGTSRIHP